MMNERSVILTLHVAESAAYINIANENIALGNKWTCLSYTAKHGEPIESANAYFILAS